LVLRCTGALRLRALGHERLFELVLELPHVFLQCGLLALPLPVLGLPVRLLDQQPLHLKTPSKRGSHTRQPGTPQAPERTHLRLKVLLLVLELEDHGLLLLHHLSRRGMLRPHTLPSAPGAEAAPRTLSSDVHWSCRLMRRSSSCSRPRDFSSSSWHRSRSASVSAPLVRSADISSLCCWHSTAYRSATSLHQPGSQSDGTVTRRTPPPITYRLCACSALMASSFLSSFCVVVIS
jgi:hypothetical protein